MPRLSLWVAAILGLMSANGSVEGWSPIASKVLAQTPSNANPSVIRPASSNSAVGVVDIAQVFRQHAGFKRSTEEMKQEFAAFEVELTAQRQQLSQQHARQKTVAVGSAEYRRLEEEIARRISQLQVRQ